MTKNIKTDSTSTSKAGITNFNDTLANIQKPINIKHFKLVAQNSSHKSY